MGHIYTDMEGEHRLIEQKTQLVMVRTALRGEIELQMELIKEKLLSGLSYESVMKNDEVDEREEEQVIEEEIYIMERDNSFLEMENKGLKELLKDLKGDQKTLSKDTDRCRINLEGPLEVKEYEDMGGIVIEEDVDIESKENIQEIDLEIEKAMKSNMVEALGQCKVLYLKRRNLKDDCRQMEDYLLACLDTFSPQESSILPDILISSSVSIQSQVTNTSLDTDKALYSKV